MMSGLMWFTILFLIYGQSSFGVKALLPDAEEIAVFPSQNVRLLVDVAGPRRKRHAAGDNSAPEMLGSRASGPMEARHSRFVRGGGGTEDVDNSDAAKDHISWFRREVTYERLLSSMSMPTIDTDPSSREEIISSRLIDTDPSSREEIITTRLVEVSRGAALDPTTPQGQARDWIIEEDPAELNQRSPALLQRYAMAVLYFSLDGENWFDNRNWLSGESVCDWFGASAQCDESDAENPRVSHLILRTCATTMCFIFLFYPKTIIVPDPNSSLFLHIAVLFLCDRTKQPRRRDPIRTISDLGSNKYWIPQQQYFW
jgi:hypothetical protein